MKKVLSMVVSGVAVCLLFNGVSALCQTASDPAVESPKVAGLPPAVAEHPLMPVIRWAEKGRPDVVAIKDYTATLQKQENIGGTVQSAQVMEVKVRHQPFSVYVKLRFPKDINGQQAIYVEGQHDGKAYARGNGAKGLLGWQKLPPDGLIMMNNNKYPITDMGILNLLDKLLEVGYKDSKFGECDVTYTEGVKIGPRDAQRECTMIQVVHPMPRQNFTFHVARVFVDKELNLPISYMSYDWSRKEGEAPVMLEAYTYLNLQLNVGLTDADFDPKNPKYASP